METFDDIFDQNDLHKIIIFYHRNLQLKSISRYLVGIVILVHRNFKAHNFILIPLNKVKYSS